MEGLQFKKGQQWITNYNSIVVLAKEVPNEFPSGALSICTSFRLMDEVLPNICCMDIVSRLPSHGTTREQPGRHRRPIATEGIVEYSTEQCSLNAIVNFLCSHGIVHPRTLATEKITGKLLGSEEKWAPLDIGYSKMVKIYILYRPMRNFVYLVLAATFPGLAIDTA